MFKQCEEVRLIVGMAGVSLVTILLLLLQF